MRMPNTNPMFGGATPCRWRSTPASTVCIASDACWTPARLIERVRDLRMRCEAVNAPECSFAGRAPASRASRFPVVGLFDRVRAAADLEAIFELEGWTNDRISASSGSCKRSARRVGRRPADGLRGHGRLLPSAAGRRAVLERRRGAWYAARTIDTALSESIYHRHRELAEVGGSRPGCRCACTSPTSPRAFTTSRPRTRLRALRSRRLQRIAALRPQLLAAGSHGVVYRSVRHPGASVSPVSGPRS
jgi:hypothetical protein